MGNLVGRAMPISPDAVLEALRSVQDPDLRRDIVSLGFIKNVDINGPKVAFTLELTTPACPVKDLLKSQCEQAVLAIPGVESVEVEMTARVASRQLQPEELLPDVKQILAIASGKGGVGKSTVTVNLAVCLAQAGASVGLLDADVYGPSIPSMMGLAGESPLVKDSKLVPLERYGVKTMSLGNLLDSGQAVLWRGPLVASTVKQLLSDVLWGELDYLLVDLPPGTGDAPMSLAQLVPLAGVVLVTTPHAMAATIAGKSAQLFRRLDTPVLGIIENMATFVCPGCRLETRVFAGPTGEDLARDFEAPYLGSIPLDPEVSRSADLGKPAVLISPDSRQAQAFQLVAQRTAQVISIAAIRRAEQAASAQNG